MPQELIYTSVPKGLKSGSSGFSTVLHTTGMAPNLIGRLESLSGYTYLFPPDSSQAGLNPPVLTHYRLELAGKAFHVISRNAPYGMDYTGRSNNLAHHIVFQSNEELPSCGPDVLLQNCMEKEFTGSPRVVPFAREISFPIPPQMACPTWKKVTGDAGWAAQLAGTAQTDQLAVVLYKPGTDTTALVAEALHLLPEKERWKVTFSTCFTVLQAGLKCQWRFIPLIPGEKPKVPPKALILDLTAPLEKAPDTPLAELARTGRMTQRVPKPATPAVPAARSAPVAAAPKEQERRPRQDAAPRGPMEVPVASFDPQRVYTPQKKKSGLLWWISGTVVLLMVLGGLAFMAFSITQKQLADVSLTDEDESAVSDDETSEIEGEDEEEEEEGETTDPEADPQTEAGTQKGQTDGSLTSQLTPQDPNQGQQEKKVRIQLGENGGESEKPLERHDDLLVCRWERKCDVEIQRLEGESQIQEENGWYCLDGQQILTLEKNKTLKFRKSDQLDEFLKNYKIVIREWKYELAIDDQNPLNLEFLLDDGGIIPLDQKIDLGKLVLESKSKEKAKDPDFQFDALNLKIKKIASNGKEISPIDVLIYSPREHAFQKGSDCSADVLHEFCDQYRFRTDKNTVRVPVYISTELVAFLENTEKGPNSNYYTLEYLVPEGCKGEPQIQNDEDPQKFPEKIKVKYEDKIITMTGYKRFFKGVSLRFVEAPEQPEEETKLLTLDEINKENFWYDNMYLLPKAKEIQAVGFFLDNNKKVLLADKDHKPALTFTKKIDREPFQIQKKDESNMPHKLKIDFSPDGHDHVLCFIFLTPPNYGMDKLTLTRRVPTKSQPNQQLQLLSCTNRNPCITIKNGQKDENLQFDIKIDQNDKTIVHFTSNNENIKLKAKATIQEDGQLVMDFVEKPKVYQDLNWPSQFQNVEFDWKIVEDGHLRWTSEAKKQ